MNLAKGKEKVTSEELFDSGEDDKEDGTDKEVEIEEKEDTESDGADKD